MVGNTSHLSCDFNLKRKSLTHTFNDPLQRTAAARSLEAYFFLHTLFALSERSFDLPFARRSLARCTRRSRSRPCDCLRLCGGDSGRSLFPSFLPCSPLALSRPPSPLPLRVTRRLRTFFRQTRAAYFGTSFPHAVLHKRKLIMAER